MRYAQSEAWPEAARTRKVSVQLMVRHKPVEAGPDVTPFLIKTRLFYQLDPTFSLTR
jgi:hypothetical protein